ncbi:hypothetical protein D9M70_509450 [compost metagenome]
MEADSRKGGLGNRAGRSQPVSKRIDSGRLMTQRLHQPHDAIGMARRADQHRDDPVFLQEPRGDRVDRVACRRPIFDQLLEQPVVELGEMFQQFGARLLLALHHRIGDLDQRRGLAFAVAPGALGDQVAGADNLVAFADRHLAQEQHVAGIVLERGDHVTQPRPRLVHAVDEENAGRARGLDHLEIGRGQHRLLRRRRDAEHAGIAGNQRMLRVAKRLGSAGCIERAPGFAAKLEFREVQSIGRNSFSGGPLQTGQLFCQRGFSGL